MRHHLPKDLPLLLLPGLLFVWSVALAVSILGWSLMSAFRLLRMWRMSVMTSRACVRLSTALLWPYYGMQSNLVLALIEHFMGEGKQRDGQRGYGLTRIKIRAVARALAWTHAPMLVVLTNAMIALMLQPMIHRRRRDTHAFQPLTKTVQS